MNLMLKWKEKVVKFLVVVIFWLRLIIFIFYNVLRLRDFLLVWGVGRLREFLLVWNVNRWRDFILIVNVFRRD